MTGDVAAFGKQLCACRRSAGLSQEELAGPSGLSIRAIANLERGRTRWPHPGSVRRLADALELRDRARAEFVAAAGRRLVRDAAASSRAASDDRLVAAGGGRVVPRQLPGSVRLFVGRGRELADLTDRLERAGSTPAAMVISAIGGAAGVGKTALAVHWAHQVAERFPDGQLYVNLRGYDPGRPMSASDALAGFLRALGVAGPDIPGDADERAAAYRSLLAGRRMLVVLDNAREVGQVRPLLPGSPGCVTVVTSRDALAGLVAGDGAVRLDVDLLPLSEAVSLLRGLIGTRVDEDLAAAVVLARQCCGLPLALRVAAELAAARPGVPLASLAAELADLQHRLDVLETGGDDRTAVRSVFSWSYRYLSLPAARMFRLLGSHPGPDTTVPAAASLAGLPPVQAQHALGELTRAHLISEHLPGRYACHDLLRAFATEQAHVTDDQAARRAATGRVLDHYLHTAHAADMLLNPARDQISLPAHADGVRPQRLRDHGQALEWFRAEHKVLLAALALAADTGFDAQTWQLAWTMVDFFEFLGHWHDWIATQRMAIAATQRLADQAADARCCRALGYAYARTGSDSDAHAHLTRALSLFRQVDDPVGQARTHQDLSWMLDRQGKPARALDHDRLALQLYQEAGHAPGQANALNAIGWLHAVLGDYRQAVDHCSRALALHRALGNRRGEAAALDSIGYAHHHLAEHAEAVTHYRRSLTLFRELSDRSNQAEILNHLGDTHNAAGEPQQARDAWQQAFDILQELDHPDADQLRAKLAG
jgi:tetratricopeptide (TPR) repeat protein/transcriptional regulator with XRE-family HTH domain